jgi:hypothetical protein
VRALPTAGLAEAKKVGADVSAMGALEMERLIQSVYSTPRAIIERAAAIIKGSDHGRCRKIEANSLKA